MEYHLGVDLGTTFAAAAAAGVESTVMVGLGNRALQVPSVVYLPDDGRDLFGEAADLRSSTDPRFAIREFKRRIGDPVPVLVAGRPYSAESLSGRLLRWIIATSSDRIGSSPVDVTLTHPAHWSSYKIDSLRHIAAVADLDVVRTCTEPVAAAIQYAAQERVHPGDRLVVYDLGGGTFDACVLERSSTGFNISGPPVGVERLGGIDFDEAVFRWALEQAGLSLLDLELEDPSMIVALGRLRRDCTAAKEALSFDVEAQISLSLPGFVGVLRFTRHELEGLIRPAIMETIDSTRRAIRLADSEPEKLTAILMVGGSSRIPLVTELLGSQFRCPLRIDAHPKDQVAMGAARAAQAGLIGVTATASAASLPQAEDDELRTGSRSSGRVGRATAHRTTRRRTPRRSLVVGAAAVLVVVGVAALMSIRLSGGSNSGDQGSTAPSAITGDIATSESLDSAPASDLGDLLPGADPLPVQEIIAPLVVDGSADLFRVDTDSGVVTARLTKTAAGDRSPVLSPDRRSIVYGVVSSDGRKLHVMAVDGTGDRLLFNSPAAGCEEQFRPTWSPVDTQLLALVCIDAADVSRLRLVRLDGTLVREITTGLPQVGDPSFSPDGSSLVFWGGSVSAGDGGSLFRIEMDGAEPATRLTDPGEGLDGDPRWSPDSTTIAFWRGSTAGARGDIFVIDQEGAGLRQLTDEGEVDANPVWSPDGERIVFVRSRLNDSSGSSGRLWVMRLANGETVPLIGDEAIAATSSVAWAAG